jgi:hypothetical protein
VNYIYSPLFFFCLYDQPGFFLRPSLFSLSFCYLLAIPHSFIP